MPDGSVSQVAERRGSPAYFIGALLASLGFVALCFGGMTLLMRAGERPIRPAVDDYFAKFNANDFAGIYANAARSLTDTMPEDRFIQGQSSIHKALGNLQSMTLRGIAEVRERGPALTLLTYDAHFDNGPATVGLSFQYVDGSIKLASAEFRSELLPRQERGRGRFRGQF